VLQHLEFRNTCLPHCATTTHDMIHCPQSVGEPTSTIG
jgi:hypothetical protein